MNKVNQVLTDIFKEKLASGELPWSSGLSSSGVAPANLKSGKAYRGSNVFMTAMQGYNNPYWLTYKQIGEFGGKLKKEQGYTPLIFFKVGKREKNGEEKSYAILRYYRVWNVEQCEGLSHKRITEFDNRVPSDHNPIESAEAIVQRYKGPSVSFEGMQPCYIPSRDHVRMPCAENYDSMPRFYSTFFHELTHSTGHHSRLARDGVVNPITFASHDYSFEELVAELGASFLRADAGINGNDLMDNSAAYLQHWIKALDTNPEWIIKAASQAQKACDLILGTDRDDRPQGN